MCLAWTPGIWLGLGLVLVAGLVTWLLHLMRLGQAQRAPPGRRVGLAGPGRRRPEGARELPGLPGQRAEASCRSSPRSSIRSVVARRGQQRMNIRVKCSP